MKPEWPTDWPRECWVVSGNFRGLYFRRYLQGVNVMHGDARERAEESAAEINRLGGEVSVKKQVLPLGAWCWVDAELTDTHHE